MTRICSQKEALKVLLELLQASPQCTTWPQPLHCPVVRFQLLRAIKKTVLLAA